MDDLRATRHLHKPENKNATWIAAPSAWAIYVVILVASRILLAAIIVSTVTGWTTWNVTHSIITFLTFHWVKGVPFTNEEQLGKYDSLTMWEQLDDGVQYTPTRKFLTVVPIVLFLVASHFTNYHLPSLLFNLAGFLLVFIPKQPFMNKRRLFGINS